MGVLMLMLLLLYFRALRYGPFIATAFIALIAAIMTISYVAGESVIKEAKTSTAHYIGRILKKSIQQTPTLAFAAMSKGNQFGIVSTAALSTAINSAFKSGSRALDALKWSLTLWAALFITIGGRQRDLTKGRPQKKTVKRMTSCQKGGGGSQNHHFYSLKRMTNF